MSGTDTILLTKLYAPLPRPDFVARPRLSDRLDEGRRQGHRLLLLSAPAGYGKTTLLAEWLRQGEGRFAWLSLDARDNDPLSFFSYLIAALRQIDPTAGQVAANLLSAPELPPPLTLATTLANDMMAIATPFTLILDDYHTVFAPAIHEVVAFLLEHRLPQLLLVISTRVEPPLPLPRLRVSGSLTEIRAADLRFTPDETRLFFRQTMQVKIDADALKTLDERTEGWVASLQLAALSLRGQDAAQVDTFVAAFRGSHHYVIDYLIDEILRRQDAAMRDFLRQTAALDRFCAPLCAAVTGRADSREVLAWMEAANLFLIPLDAERVWYRYHHLVGDALRAEFSSDRQQQRLIQRRAAAWLAAHGFAREALHYALAVEAWDEAAAYIKQAASQAFEQFELGLLDSWLRALPAPTLLADPELVLLRALIPTATNYPEIKRSMLARLEEVPREQLSPRSWGRLAGIRAWTALEQAAPDAAQRLQEAQALYGEDDPLLRQRNHLALGLAERLAGNTVAAGAAYAQAIRLGGELRAPMFTMYATRALAFTLIERGRQHEALALCERARAESVDARGQPLPTSELLLAPLATCAYEANDLVVAHKLALRGRDELRRLHIERNGGLETAQILILASAGRGDWEDAWRFIAEARQLASPTPWFVPCIEALEANLHLRLGNVAAATHWFEKARGSLQVRPNEFLELRLFTYARLLLAQERLDEAGGLLDQLEAQVRAGGRHAGLITVRGLQALAAASLGRHDIAVARLSEAIQLAAPAGYVRRLLDEGPALARLLPFVRATAPAFVDQLLSGLAPASTDGGLAPVVATRTSLAQPLTPQELNVLRLLAAGHSYQEIADRLVISLGTARWHVHNLYAKLGAANRTQGINQARELGLL